MMHSNCLFTRLVWFQDMFKILDEAHRGQGDESQWTHCLEYSPDLPSFAFFRYK